jgi:hypothetical protein
MYIEVCNNMHASQLEAAVVRIWFHWYYMVQTVLWNKIIKVGFNCRSFGGLSHCPKYPVLIRLPGYIPAY